MREGGSLEFSRVMPPAFQVQILGINIWFLVDSRDSCTGTFISSCGCVHKGTLLWQNVPR